MDRQHVYRMQQDLRKSIDLMISSGWEIICRNPIKLQRGRVVKELYHGAFFDNVQPIVAVNNDHA